MNPVKLNKATMVIPAAIDRILQQLLSIFSGFAEVDGLLLAGSLSSGTSDAQSDIDVYVYLNTELPATKREALIAPLALYHEIDNRFWETEDCFIMAGSGIKVELMYRSEAWMREQLECVLDRCEASVGFSTCLVHNYVTSHILFDRSGSLRALQNQYDRPYPEALAQAILDKNRPLLKNCSSSYLKQIALAVSRADWISVNHRVAALLASYFDILFAINRQWHPGEKKLLRIALQDCALLPSGIADDIGEVLELATQPAILLALERLIDRLETLIDSA